MFVRALTVALVLAAAVSVQGQGKPQPPKGQAAAAAPPARYVPAILQQRLSTLAGCLRQDGDIWVLHDATVAQQGDVKQSPAAAGATAYAIEGISNARLSVLDGKRVQVSGAFQGQMSKPGAQAALPRFEATNVTEEEKADACPAGP